MAAVIWVAPEDCIPPHGLDLKSRHDADKVNMLVEAFSTAGFDKRQPALVGYPHEGKIQLLSGTHRHEAALRTGTKLPVVMWLSSHIKEAWGELEDWMTVIKDIPVANLETWTREDIEREKYGRHAT